MRAEYIHELYIPLGDAGTFECDVTYVLSGADVEIKTIKFKDKDLTWMFTQDRLADYELLIEADRREPIEREHDDFDYFSLAASFARRSKGEIA